MSSLEFDILKKLMDSGFIPVFHRGFKPRARDEIYVSWLDDPLMNNREHPFLKHKCKQINHRLIPSQWELRVDFLHRSLF